MSTESGATVSTILQSDDIAIDAFVAIHSKVHRPMVEVPPIDPSEAPASLWRLIARRVANGGENDTSALPAPMGAPLRVAAIARPYVMCMMIVPGSEMGPLIVDLRDVRLMPVDDCYVGAVRNAPAQESDQGPTAAASDLIADGHDGP